MSTPTESVPLADDEITAMMSSFGVSVITYDKLAYYATFTDLFNAYGDLVVLLYQSDTQPVGHFILLTNRTNDEVEYFDPCGRDPDVPNEIINESETNKNRHYLDELYNNSVQRNNKLKMTINGTELQDPHANTCGKWCISRALALKCSLAQYVELMKKIKASRVFSNLDDYINQTLSVPKRH